MRPKISVIVPIYNAELYLEQCIESVLNQTLRDIELLLIDDGSTDNSFLICEKYKKRDNRIQLYTNKNVGQGFYEIIYVFLTIFLYLPKCPQSLILSALRAFCFCGKPHISRSIFLYFRYQAWLKSW